MVQHAAGNRGVTIIVPVFNRAQCLLRTLRSIPEEFRLIVVDNGSTDGSAKIAADFCQQRPAAVFAEEHEAGAPAARNRGLALCKTPWVYFFDSDDEFTSLPTPPEIPESPENTENRGTPLPTAPLDLICFPVRMIVDGRERTRDYRPTADAATHVLSAMLSTQSMLFRTAWLRAIGGWNNGCRIWNDWELGLRALLNKPRLQWVTDEPRHRIYVHPDSITGPSYSARTEAIETSLAEAYADVRRAINTDGHNDSRRTLRALDFRVAIVCGTLRREGSPAAADSIRRLTDHPCRTLRLLEWSVAHGLRGAWRIALALL